MTQTLLWCQCPNDTVHPEHDYEPTTTGRPRRCLGRERPLTPSTEFPCSTPGGCGDLDCPCDGQVVKAGHHGPHSGPAW